jgi:hypothetical protein
MEEVSAYIADVINQRIRKTRDEMRAASISDEEINAAFELMPDAAQLHSETMTKIERFISDPDAPLHTTQ